MKKLFFTAACVFLLKITAYAQVESIATQTISADDKKKMEDTLQGWKFGGNTSLTFNQAAFVNWAAGGTNSIAFLFNSRIYGDYKKEKHLFQNWLYTEYGFLVQKNTGVEKNADRWELFSKYGYKLAKKVYVAEYVDVRSLFSKTNFIGTDSIISRPGSPLILEGAVGIDWVPNAYFSLFVSPIASKTTFITDDAIAATGTYGNVPPKNKRAEIGAVLIASYKQDVCKNVNITSVLKVYKDYLNGPAQNIDVDWQTTIGLKVNDYISASIFTYLLWDYDVTQNDPDTGELSRKVQFRDVIGIGLTYKTNWFKTKEVKAKKL